MGTVDKLTDCIGPSTQNSHKNEWAKSYCQCDVLTDLIISNGDGDIDHDDNDNNDSDVNEYHFGGDNGFNDDDGENDGYGYDHNLLMSLMLAGNEFQSLGRAVVKEDEYEEVRWDGIVSIVSWRERVFRLWREERNPQRSGVCGELTMDRSTVFRWATRFRVSLDDDARPGRQKTSTHEQSVKLVAGALQEDRRATCEELPEATRISPNSVFRILTKNFKKRKFLHDGSLTF
ncbi:hypothetical protein ANN_12541 [Periplaneta americana]|uniref:Uncharacterized protein n=1 Tax=Periplaneta americana TaxID=6978 RepID=A0ABQ8TGT1_PERAM|nr:hypothetical protein ANN_12541 [Periplaneta americana]